MAIKKTQIFEEEGCKIRVVHLDRVNRARSESILDRKLERLAQIYRLLGDPTRLRIAMALKNGEMCVCDMAALLGLSESAVSHQIRRLKDASLVKGRREGQVLYYSLDDQHVVDLIQVGMDHIEE